VEWTQNTRSSFYASLQILILDRPGYLAALAERISKLGLNLFGINTQTNNDSTIRINISVQINSVDEIAELMGKIRQLPGTLDVYRIKS